MPPDRVAPQDVDETPLPAESPKEYVRRVARAKAYAAVKAYPDAYIVAADTIAVAGRQVIGKAKDAADARRILETLSGRRHQVLTGLCVIAPNGMMRQQVIVSRVKCKRLSMQELQEYLDSGEWQGKSGCYGLQSRGAGLVEWINGSYTSIIGLPLVEVRNLLTSLGYVPKPAGN